MNTAPPPKNTTKIPLLSISLTRAEGLASECGTTTFTTYDAANKHLAKTCQSMDPKMPGSNKHDFTLTFADGMTYTGSFETYHPHHRSHEAPDLGKHAEQHMLFVAGLWRPPHMDDAAYDRIMEAQRRDHPRRESAAVTFLSTYALVDLPRPAVTEDDGRNAQSIGDAVAEVVAATDKPVVYLALDIAIQQVARVVTMFEKEVDRLRADGLPYAEMQTRAMTARKALGILNTATNRNR